jgi:hypothetical protein
MFYAVRVSETRDAGREEARARACAVCARAAERLVTAPSDSARRTMTLICITLERLGIQRAE